MTNSDEVHNDRYTFIIKGVVGIALAQKKFSVLKEFLDNDFLDCFDKDDMQYILNYH